MAGITALKRTGYLHGGVTHPDGRRGFFKGAEKDSREKGTNISPGTVGAGANIGGRRDDNPYAGGDVPKTVTITDSKTKIKPKIKKTIDGLARHLLE